MIAQIFPDSPDFGTMDPRLPTILLLDVSRAMNGMPINQLNDGLLRYKDELAADLAAARRIEISIITFGGFVRSEIGLCGGNAFNPQPLVAGGDRPIGQAISLAIALLKERIVRYEKNGIPFHRPWIFMISAGVPTDSWESAAREINEGEQRREFSFFGVALDDRNLSSLKQICVRAPLKLKDLRFRDLFSWLACSQNSVARSKLGEEIGLVNPLGPNGWATC